MRLQEALEIGEVLAFIGASKRWHEGREDLQRGLQLAGPRIGHPRLCAPDGLDRVADRGVAQRAAAQVHGDPAPLIPGRDLTLHLGLATKVDAADEQSRPESSGSR